MEYCQQVLIKLNEITQILGRQISAARSLVGMDQKTLAGAANISLPTLRRMEASEGPASGLKNNVLAVRAALEAAGIEFINDERGDGVVRLRR